MILREQIYSRLWTIAENAAQFTTKSRRLTHWADVPAVQMPALYMSEKGGTAETRGNAFNAPVVHILKADFYIYVHSSDPYRSPAEVLNPLIDSIELALAPNPVTGVQQLGLPGMVSHVRIQGQVLTDEGVLGDKAIAVVPVEILCV